MRITVAICTWNRAELLAPTLEAMTRLCVPADVAWELLVVNNRCTDSTNEVLKRYLGRLPLRLCWEPEPGLSHARNRAVGEAGGDYLIWTDDDVLVDENWLLGYCRAFQTWPEAAVFGGPVAPWFAGNPPKWLVCAFPRVAAAYATVDLGDRPFQLRADSPLPYGANMAVRMREQRERRYDPLRGVRGATRGLGEETFLLQSILKAGGIGWWVPGAQVRHYIPPHRQTIRYLREYFTAYGRSWAGDIEPRTDRHWFGRPRWLLRRIVEWELRYRARRLWGSPASWVEALIHASAARGLWSGWKIARPHASAVGTVANV